MTAELTKAAQQAPKIKELVEQLRNIANGVRICGVDDRRFVAGRLDEIADALTQRPAAQTERGLVAAVDAAMVEMKNISPPLRRSECERLIRAAAECMPAHQQATPEIDYTALIHASWGKHKYAQGTGLCIAFKHGAEWFRAQLAARPKAVPMKASRSERIASLQAELNLLREQEAKEIISGAPNDLRSECLALVDSRRMVGAIKHYREKVGCGLLEAKYAVEAMVTGRLAHGITAPAGQPKE